MVLLAALLGFVLVFAVLGLFIYGLVAKDRRKGLRASVVGLVLALLSALLSTPFWIAAFSGHGSHGEELHASEDGPIYFLVAVEALAIAAALAGVVRQARRQ